MDTTVLTSEFKQYTLLQKKLFLDWIELPIEHEREEEARQRFYNSLNNPNYSHGEGQIDEIKIQQRFNSFIQEMEARMQRLCFTVSIAKQRVL